MHDSFYPVLQNAAACISSQGILAATERDVLRALDAERPDEQDFLALLSPAAAPHLEAMAQRAQQETLRHFGRAVQLITPLYLANYCTNHCVYCGFCATNRIERTMLQAQDIVREGQAIAASGLRHVLLLTGDAPKISSVEYIAQAARLLRPYFPGIGVEIYSLTVEEYVQLVEAGVDSLTLFQESYDEALYATVHPKGPKKDFAFRLDSQHRAALAGMRTVNVGALIGLGEWRREMALLGLHAHWLQSRHPSLEVGISVPRMCPHEGSFNPEYPASERDLAQIIAALRIFLPASGITLSTRERAYVRDNMLPLGVTRLSAGVSTAVGGHVVTQEDATNQFDISDTRSVEEVATALRARGYQPVFKHWEPIDGAYKAGKAV